MLDISALNARLAEDENWVLFDTAGAPLDLRVPRDIGPATLLVSPVTDALKTMNEDGLVVESLDRAHVWSVVGYALNRVVLKKLDHVKMSPEQLYEAVVGLRLGWQVKA
ncbi:MAG: hypothetical protein WBM90_09455, partial [Acidimicrobiia bacterium]